MKRVFYWLADFLGYSTDSETISINSPSECEKNTEHMKNEANFNLKQTNEYGIAGFVFSSILMVHEGFLISLEQARFNNMGNIKETIPVILLPLILFSTSIISSIKGCLKDGQLYQKGLAKVGLFFNIIIFIVFVYTVLQGFSAGGGGREVDDLQGRGLTLH